MKPVLAAVSLAALLCASGPVRAETVLELFTSQSCSSCPPAEALLAELASQPGVLALGLHVDYWDRLGWKDPYSSAGYTARQRRYAALLDDDSIYTPELVVNGRTGVVGSDRRAVASAITASQAGPQVPLHLTRDGAGLVADAGAGAGVRRFDARGVRPAPRHAGGRWREWRPHAGGDQYRPLALPRRRLDRLGHAHRVAEATGRAVRRFPTTPRRSNHRRGNTTVGRCEGDTAIPDGGLSAPRPVRLLPSIPWPPGMRSSCWP